MKEEAIKARIDALLNQDQNSGRVPAYPELFHGALSIMTILYGPQSPQADALIKSAEIIRNKYASDAGNRYVAELAEGALHNMKAELDAGLVGSLSKTLTGEVLADFLQLARAALEEKGDDAKNVAAVLTAALFEDTIRRLAVTNGISHIDKLQDVITELKNKGILQGSQVGIATAYLNFRNNSLHAQWDKVEREAVSSALGFAEELLVKHFG